MNHKETYQLMYMNHTQRINTYVTPMKMNHQERTIKNVITPPPRTPPTNTQHINTDVTSMKMNHRGPGRTSPCHKNHMNHIFMQHSMIVVDTCTKYKNMQIIRGPESRVTKNMPFSVHRCSLS